MKKSAAFNCRVTKSIFMNMTDWTSKSIRKSFQNLLDQAYKEFDILS